MTAPLIITAGKRYRTRDEREARVYATDGLDSFPIHGAILNKPGGWVGYQWGRDGSACLCGDNVERSTDLISEWHDEPVVPWEKYPAWVVAIARDEGGLWYGYDSPPTPYSTMWDLDDGFITEIHPRYYPSFTGDWRNSLVQRPQAQ